MSMDWGTPNYIPPSQDYGRTQSNLPDDNYDTVCEPGLLWRFLDTTGFKVIAVLGMAWIVFMCFEAYQSSFHTARHARRASIVVMHTHAHRKD